MSRALAGAGRSLRSVVWFSVVVVDCIQKPVPLLRFGKVSDIDRPFPGMTWVTCDGENHVYHFEFPLVYLGRLRPALNPPAEATIEEIWLCNNPEYRERVGLVTQTGNGMTEYVSPPILLSS